PLGGLTSSTKAGDLQRVPGRREPVLTCGLPEPFVHLAAFELGHAVAARADEMVMVPLAAEAVTGLARPGRELVEDTVLAEKRKRPVDGGEADRVAALAKARVDLLRRRIVGLGRERLENEQALARRAEPGLRQSVARGALRVGHRPVRYRRDETENHSHIRSHSPADRMRTVRAGGAWPRGRELLSARVRGEGDCARRPGREPDASGSRAARPRALPHRRRGGSPGTARPPPRPRLPTAARGRRRRWGQRPSPPRHRRTRPAPQRGPARLARPYALREDRRADRPGPRRRDRGLEAGHAAAGSRR